MHPFTQAVGQPVGAVGGDPVGSPPPLEMHFPVLGLPSHVHCELLLHDPLLVMSAQLNGVGAALVGLGVGKFVGAGVGGFEGAGVGCVIQKQSS